MNTTAVADLRKRRGWTQERLASESGVTTRTIQRIEAGSGANLQTLSLLAGALEVDVQDLFSTLDDADKQRIADFDRGRIGQMRARSTWSSWYRKLAVFIFILAMVLLGSRLTLTLSLDHPLPTALTMLWVLLWPVGLALLKTLRNTFVEPYLDKKYPLTTGTDVAQSPR
ncbi:MAG: helix-turn-helix domain-containing protein [Bifidobacterium sp.]|jgi:transcriptional regulator with XRE-family HTH domain|nr:helix-turn-helix domain-containing protein [Bifidobacterium sp.]